MKAFRRPSSGRLLEIEAHTSARAVARISRPMLTRSPGLRRIMLATADAHGVYAKLGFEPLAQPDIWMALVFE